MQISRSRAVAVLDALRYLSADSWPARKMEDKFRVMAAVPAADMEKALAAVKDPAVLADAQDLLRASARNQPISVVEDDERQEQSPVTQESSSVNAENEYDLNDDIDDGADAAPAVATRAPTKPAAKPAVKPAAKVTPKSAAKAAPKPAAKSEKGGAERNGKAVAKVAAKPATKSEKGGDRGEAAREKAGAAGRDKFGRKLGTQAANINKFINGTPKTVKELQTASGATLASVNSHLRNLLAQGFVTRVDGKFIEKKA